MDLWRARRPRDAGASDDGSEDGAGPGVAPVALAVPGRHGPVVHGVSPSAAASGIRTGMRMADARAALPGLVVEEVDPVDEARALERLARWAQRWCPWVAVDGHDGLVLDVTGSAHLFGGEAGLLSDIAARFAATGLAARAAVAPNRGAAWGLSRFGPPDAVCRDLRDLDPLPVAALRLATADARALARLGLKTVGALRVVPRASLRRRFAAGVAGPLARLDQALGRAAEPVASLDAPPDRRAALRLAEAVQDPAPLIPNLCAALAATLARQGEGCRRLRLTVCRVDGETRAVEAALARPTADATHMAGLFRDRLEGIDPGFGFDAVILEAVAAERLDAAQPDLTGAVDEAETLARLVDTLSARLGPRAVTRPVFRDSHVPERAQAWRAAVTEDGNGAAPPGSGEPPLDRPIVLLDPPEPVTVIYAVPEGPPVRMEWRRRPLTVARHAGPERIAPEWWRDRPGTRLRDYYRIEDEGGRRYWLYREGVAGDGRGAMRDDGREIPPRWFMHGLFG